MNSNLIENKVEHECAPFSRDDMLKILPVVLSDLKYAGDLAGQVRNNGNIKRSLYRHVIRGLYDENKFQHNEPGESHRVNMYIKGFVRDVISYLSDAYDVIHSTDFECEFSDEIANTE